ncbi:DUF1540 domain-containing protein [Sporosarcina sp. P13]|nr:DUF1540 domain-containing protein [Sporosarcina sp. P13]PIC64543.1 DUF1540 domain-containing protein [Sporosarcina sp. P13]
MAKDVLCEVTNCNFWESGNKCSAEEIRVVTRKGKKARDSAETDCETFVPKV